MRRNYRLFFGGQSISLVIAGLVVNKIGSPRTILIGRHLLLDHHLWFALRLPGLREIVRPIYMERGIIAAAEIEAGTKAL